MSDAPRQHRILLVDDEPGILEGLQMLFELEGYEVLTASDGEQALELVRDAHPDLVLTDYMMPRMDGLTLVTALRAEPETAALLIVVSSAVTLPAGEARDSADAILRKPVSIDQVLEVVEGLLARH